MILMYHKVDVTAPTKWWVTLPKFHNQILSLAAAGKKIVFAGYSISPSEVRQGERLQLANYRPRLYNKYSDDAHDKNEHFDIVVDNNPSTFGCCRYHFINMLSRYAAQIRPNGIIVTDRVGLSWVVSRPGADPRWSFDFDDWAALGRLFGLKSTRVTDYVYLLAYPTTSIPRAGGA
jgi:hypothetical protein